MTDAQKITALSQALEALLDAIMDGQMGDFSEKEEEAVHKAQDALAATSTPQA